MHKMDLETSASESVFRQWALKYMVKQDNIFSTQGRTGDAWGWKTIISLRNDILRMAGSVDAAHERFQEEEYQVSKWYEFFKPASTKVYWWKVWRSWAWERHKYILWLAARKSLATSAMLKERGINARYECVFCTIEGGDSCNNLLFKCAFTNDVWGWILHWATMARRQWTFQRELRWYAKHCKGSA